MKLPYNDALAVATSMNLFAAPSTSVALSNPIATGSPATALLIPPASFTVPVVVPVITAASFVPAMLTVTTLLEPSEVVTVKLSV